MFDVLINYFNNISLGNVIIPGLITGLIVACLFHIINKLNKREYAKSVKNSIHNSLNELDALFQTCNFKSNNYDVDEESTFLSLKHYLKRQLRKMGTYQFIIMQNSSLIKLNNKEKQKITHALSIIEWFESEYGFEIEPSVSQKVKWRTNRQELDQKTAAFEEISETFIAHKIPFSELIKRWKISA
ncbi:MAG: hypothetical protein V3U87_15990 [Methylococcaceae bacterium]